MKRIIYLLFAVLTSVCLLAGCQKEDERVKAELVGDWHYSGTENGVEMDVWVSFAADGSFEMYQLVGEGAYWHSTGVYSYNGKVLSGVYSDRYPWKYTYSVSVNGSSLVMKAVELESYSVTYTREAVPSEVREKALDLTKASGGYVPFL